MEIKEYTELLEKIQSEPDKATLHASKILNELTADLAKLPALETQIEQMQSEIGEYKEVLIKQFRNTPASNDPPPEPPKREDEINAAEQSLVEMFGGKQ